MRLVTKKTAFTIKQVRCETEDGVKVDGVGHLNLEISRPRGPQTITVYKKPTQDREGLVTYQPLANRYLEEAGQWSLTCHYNEHRDRLKSVLAPADHVTTSQPVQFFVHPGECVLVDLYNNGCYVQSRGQTPVNTGTEDAIDGVHINGVSVLSGFSPGAKQTVRNNEVSVLSGDSSSGV